MAKPRPGTLEALAAAAPDTVVLTEHDTGRSLTRGAWDERAGTLAVALAERFDVSHGSRVALQLSRVTLELFETVFALAKLGAAPMHLVPQTTAPPGPSWSALLTDDDAHTGEAGAILLGDDYEALLSSTPDTPRPSSGVRVAPSTFSTAASGRLAERSDDRMGRGDLAHVLGDVVERARHRQGRGHLVAAPSWLPATLLHANVTLLAGGAVILLPAFEPTAWLAAVGEHEPATAVLTPSMLGAILALPADHLESADTTSLDAVVVAGGHIPVADRRAAADLFGEDQVATLYATADAGPIAMLDPADVAEDPGTEGTPLRGVHVTIRDEDGAGVPRGTVGRIHVTSPLAVGEDVATGDLGRRDEDGRLTLVSSSTTPGSTRRY